MLPWFQQDQFPLYLAPMAGFTDVVYRQLCKREGADVLISEFVMSDSINLDHESVWEIIDFSEEQRPLGIQIFGSSPESMADAAQRIEERSKPDFIDLNFGCPSDKITNQDAGASLLKNPKALVQIAKSVVEAVPQMDVTAKIRIGWDHDNIVADEVALRLQDVGIQALAIHGRTKLQGYTGDADWEIIKRIAESVEIPIIGNGNIRTSAQVHDIKTHTDIRAVMIGRAALGYPWLFNEIKQHLETGQVPLPPTLEHRWKTIIDYAHMLSTRPLRQNDQNLIRWMRSRISKLTKDMIGSKTVRIDLAKIDYVEDLYAIAERHKARYARAEKAIFARLERNL